MQRTSSSYADVLSRPQRMPAGFWKTLAEILMTAGIIGAVVGVALALTFGSTHAHV